MNKHGGSLNTEKVRRGPLVHRQSGLMSRPVLVLYLQSEDGLLFLCTVNCLILMLECCH